MEGEEVVLDAPVETEVADAPVADDVELGTEVTAEPETQEIEQQEETTDGRALPKDIQRAVKTLRESNDPILAKAARTLNDAFFRNQRLEAEFPAQYENGQRIGPVEQAIALKAEFDAIGGAEGIAELRNRSDVMTKVDADIERGNPAFLDDIIEAFPDGFKKLGTPFLAKLAKLDLESYQNTILPVIHNTFVQNGIPQAISEIERLVSAGDGKGALGIVGQLKEFMGQVAQRVSNIPKAQADDPRDKEIADLKSKMQTEEESKFLGGIGAQTISHMNTEIKKSLAPYLKGKNLSQPALKDLAEGIDAELRRQLSAVQGYKSKVDAFKSRKDAQGAVRYINSQISQLASKAVKQVWDRRYGSVVPQKRTTPGAPVLQGQLRAKPNFDTLDHYPNWMVDAIMGKGKIKGKAVSWAK
jgi:hypothetical protein